MWGAEKAYFAGYPAVEASLGVAKILLYLVWLHAIWKCSRNVERPLWTWLARLLGIAGLAATALLY